MRYHKPFTLDQRQDAVEKYRILRNQIKRIRKDFRPRNDLEWELVHELRDAVRSFGALLGAKDAKVQVARLNDLLQQATELGIKYAYVRNNPASD